ncbi:hypothetical protein P4T04_03115 [Bacillus badius]|uniref:hypothetical protein n=1 Tax=Bacillus badius TaxID=1455 RepID=UPI002E21CE21|nr:hypothetical protein [Bacillus badius]
MKIQVAFTKTVIGWYNVKFNGEVLNLDPLTFKAYFPEVDTNSVMGCFEWDYSGFYIEPLNFVDEDSNDWNDVMDSMHKKMA